VRRGSLRLRPNARNDSRSFRRPLQNSHATEQGIFRRPVHSGASGGCMPERNLGARQLLHRQSRQPRCSCRLGGADRWCQLQSRRRYEDLSRRRGRRAWQPKLHHLVHAWPRQRTVLSKAQRGLLLAIIAASSNTIARSTQRITCLVSTWSLSFNRIVALSVAPSSSAAHPGRRRSHQ